MDQCHLLTVRTVGILTAFQYTSITTLETEGEYIEGNIGPCLVDHADNAEGNTDTTKTKTIGQCLLLGDMTEGRG